MATDEFNLKVWRVHPEGCRVQPAEKTLNGTANENGVKWCGPFSNVNRTGWWLFPPCDLDIRYAGDGKFWHEQVSE